MEHILDIIFAAILVLVVLISAKRGIILTVFDLASGLIAFLSAKLLAPHAASYLYDGFVKERVLQFLTEKYDGIENTVADALSNLSSFFSFLPKGVLEYADSAGYFDSQAISSDLMSRVTTVGELEAEIVSPVIHSLLNIVCFAVIALVLLVLLHIAGRLLSRLVKSSKIASGLDSGLGALFGVLKAALYVFILASILSVISCSSETLAPYAANSYICSFVARLVA